MRNIFRNAGERVISVPLEAMIFSLFFKSGETTDTVLIERMNRLRTAEVPDEAALFQEFCKCSGNEIRLLSPTDSRKKLWLQQIVKALENPAVPIYSALRN